MAALAVLAATSMAPAAEARTHHFSAATDVTVSFELPRSTASRTLVRFARNRLTLTSGASGALMLRPTGRHGARLAAPRGRTAHVRVELSADRGRARLSVGRRTTSVTGRFVAEDAVAVGSASLRALRIQTATAPSSPARSPATPTSPASPAAPAAPPEDGASPAPTAASALFAPTSVWNLPLADGAPLDPASSVLVKTLRDTVAQNVTAGWGPWISTYETSPLYTVPADQPTVRVQLDPGSWKVGLQQTFEAVPIPPNAAPAAGRDGHMTIWQPTTDRCGSSSRPGTCQTDGTRTAAARCRARHGRPATTPPTRGPGSRRPGGAHRHQPARDRRDDDDQRAQVRLDPARAGDDLPGAKARMYSWPAQRTDGSRAIRTRPPRALASVSIPTSTSTSSTCRR